MKKKKFFVTWFLVLAGCALLISTSQMRDFSSDMSTLEIILCLILFVVPMISTWIKLPISEAYVSKKRLFEFAGVLCTAFPIGMIVAPNRPLGLFLLIIVFSYCLMGIAWMFLVQDNSFKSAQRRIFLDLWKKYPNLIVGAGEAQNRTISLLLKREPTYQENIPSDFRGYFVTTKITGGVIAA